MGLKDLPTRPELFEGAERIEERDPFGEAYRAGQLSEIYYGPGRSERWRRPDGTEFTWEAEVMGFSQKAEVTLYVEGEARYTMTTRCDINGWRDGPWREVYKNP